MQILKSFSVDEILLTRYINRFINFGIKIYSWNIGFIIIDNLKVNLYQIIRMITQLKMRNCSG